MIAIIPISCFPLDPSLRRSRLDPVKMFRLLSRGAVRGYRVPSATPCHGYRLPKPVALPKVTPEQLQNQIQNANLVRLVSAYRTHAHKKAAIDPLGLHARSVWLLAAVLLS